MGRGLSPLQQRILNLADQEDSGIVYSYELLLEIHGLPLARAGHIGGIHFSRQGIGRRYFSGTVDVSRFLTDLLTVGLLNGFRSLLRPWLDFLTFCLAPPSADGVKPANEHLH